MLRDLHSLVRKISYLKTFNFRPRNTNKFQVAVNVAAGKKVDFSLTYQELLQRRLSHYENVIYIDPKQLVRDFKVDIYINESRPIKNLYVAPLKKDNEIIDMSEGRSKIRRPDLPLCLMYLMGGGGRGKCGHYWFYTVKCLADR